eukprot:2122995-Prymnesium_polylepis.1
MIARHPPSESHTPRARVHVRCRTSRRRVPVPFSSRPTATMCADKQSYASRCTDIARSTAVHAGRVAGRGSRHGSRCVVFVFRPWRFPSATPSLMLLARQLRVTQSTPHHIGTVRARRDVAARHQAAPAPLAAARGCWARRWAL